MELLWLIILVPVGIALDALILAWPTLHAVHYLARVKPLFWPTCKAIFLATLLGFGASFCALIPLTLIFRIDPGSLPLILPLALYFYFHAALFRRFLQTPAGTRISMQHSLIVSLIPVVVAVCISLFRS